MEILYWESYDLDQRFTDTSELIGWAWNLDSARGLTPQPCSTINLESVTWNISRGVRDYSISLTDVRGNVWISLNRRNK